MSTVQSYLFTKMVFLSLSGGVVTGVLWVLLRLGRRIFPQCVQYRLWLIPLLLFFIPVSITFPVVRTATEIPPPAAVVHSAAVTIVTPVLEAGGNLKQDPDPINPVPALQPLPPQSSDVTVRYLSITAIQTVLLGVWSSGTLWLVLRSVFRRLRFRRFDRRATWTAPAAEQKTLEQLRGTIGPVRPVQLRRFAGVSSPFCASLVHPAIFLPELPLPDSVLRQVLTHELIHCKRGDLFVKWLAEVVCTLHWWNPFAWLLRYELDCSCELSCDETAVSQWSLEDRRSYGLTILNFMRGNLVHAPTTVCLIERNIKHRLEVIMNTKRISLSQKILAGGLVLCLCMTSGALATEVNGRNPNKNGGKTYESTGIYLLQNVDKVPYEERTDGALPYGHDKYTPGSGSSSQNTGTATFTDTVFRRSFSAHISADAMYSLDLDPKLQSSSVFDIEMTRLERVLETQGEWVGQFTVRQDGVTIFEHAPGKLEHVPSLDGKRLTELTIGENGKTYFYVCFSFGPVGMQPLEGLNAETEVARKLVGHADTKRISTLQKDAVAWNGYQVVPYFENEFFMNHTLKQAYFNLMLMAENVYSSRHSPVQQAFVYLRLRPEDVTEYSASTVKGQFYLGFPNGQDLEVKGTVTGLDSGPNGLISFRSDDGRYQADFVVQLAQPSRRSDPSGKQTERFEDSQQAELLFLNTSDIAQLRGLGTDAYPFQITLAQNTVALRYTGDPLYTTGVRLSYSVGKEGSVLVTKTQDALIGNQEISLTIPKDAVGNAALTLYQVRTQPIAELRQYHISLALAPTGAVAYDVSPLFLTNEWFSGEAAQQGLCPGTDHGWAPPFLFHL